jgi:hypothetical protein
VFYSVWLRILGRRVEPREPEELPPRTVEHLEVLYAAVTGLALIDVMIGASLIVRFLTLALRTRHRLGIAAGALLRASQLATIGGPETEEERALVALSERLTDPVGSPTNPEQRVRATHALRAFLRGRWREAFELCESAYTTLPASREVWSVHGLAVFGEFALIYLGEPLELARRLPGLLSDAEQRGDVLKVVNLSVGVAPFVFLAKDEPANAQRSIAAAFTRWPQGGFLTQHWRALIARVDIDLYEGSGAKANARIAREAAAIRKSYLTRSQYLRAVTDFARARSAVAASFEEPASKSAHLGQARRAARRLESEGLPWTLALASMANAALSNALGDRESAVDHLRAAITRAGDASMALHAAAARHRLAALLGDDGLVVANAAAETMNAKGVRAPDRFAGMLLPGRWRNEN